MAKNHLTIFRLGLGRDSMTMLCLLVEKGLTAQGKRLHPQDIDAVVFTDTGAEWPHTLALIPKVKTFCKKHGLRFLVQEKPPENGPVGWRGYLKRRTAQREVLRAARGAAAKLGRGVPPWRQDPPTSIEARAASGYYHQQPPIMDDYMSRAAIILFNDAGCTEKNKILPNRAMIEDLAVERFGEWATNKEWGKRVRAGDLEPHLVLLGIAADEPHRAVKMDYIQSDSPYEDNAYPLVEMGITKAKEQAILERHGFGSVRKSGCFMCKYQPPEWYWALSVLEPEVFKRVEAYERASVDRVGGRMSLFPKKVKLIVRGKINPTVTAWRKEGRKTDEYRGKDDEPYVYGYLPLREVVARWRKANPEATIAQVMSKEYRNDNPATGRMGKKGCAEC